MMKSSGYGSLRRTGASKEAAEQKKKEKEERKMEAREEKEREKNEARQEKVKEKKNAKAKDGDAAMKEKKNEGGGGNVLTRSISFKRTTSIKALLGLKGAGGEAASPADPNKIVSVKLADDHDEDEDEAEEGADRKSEELGGEKILAAKTNDDHPAKQKKGRTKSVGGEDDEPKKPAPHKSKKDKHLKTSASHSPSSQHINASSSTATSTTTTTTSSSGYAQSSSSLYHSATTSTASPLASSAAASSRGGKKAVAAASAKSNSKKKRESWVGTISRVEKLLQTDAASPDAAATKGAHPVRIVVVGRSCGKSCMIAHLTTGKFVKSPKPTTQDLVQHTVPLDGVQYDVSILEIGSSASAKKVFPKCFGWADCFMLVYSIADSKSFHELKKLYKEIMLVEDAASLPFCIVGTHSDLEGDAREVLTAEGRSLAHEWGGRPLVEISSKTGRNVDKAFDTLVREARDFGKDKGLAHPLHAHIERGQKWVEEKKAKKEMEIQRERLEHAKKAAGSAFALIGQRERRSVREGSLRGLAGGSPTNYPEAMTSSGSEIRSRLASDSRLALNLSLASNGSSSSSSHARPRGVDLVKECEGYVIEGGQCRSELLSPRTKLKRLAGSKRNKRWYREYFHNQSHTNWVGVDPKLGPVIVSILEEKGTGGSSKTYNVRVVSRTKYGVKTKFLTKEDIGPKMKTSKVLQLAEDGLNPDCLKKVKDPKLKEDLLKFEDESRVTRFKFGVLYQRAGQVREEDMFANQDPSPGFKKFLHCLGDEIELKGWDKYSGGLDTEGREGKNSIFMLRKDYEIMFHVSTFLPFSTKNDQQVERKKHIGNDVCVIIFQEDDQCVFTPTEITSDFNHVFMVVREELDYSNDTQDVGGGESYIDSTTTTPSGKQHGRKDKEKEKDTSEDRNSNNSGHVYDSNGYGGGSGALSSESGSGSGVRAVRSPSGRGGGGGGGGVNNTGRTRYRVAITQKEGVPPYGPLIAYPPVYEAVMPRFRSILLKKLINAHNAAYEAPAFLTRRLKMREIALLDIAQKYVRVHT